MALPRVMKKRDWMRAMAQEVLQMEEEEERDEGQLRRDAAAADQWARRREGARGRASQEGHIAS
jgi:hypothetical protein